MPPTWRSAAIRGAFFAALLFPVSILFGQTVPTAVFLSVVATVFYIPLGYYTDQFFYRRRLAKLARERAAKQSEKAGHR